MSLGLEQLADAVRDAQAAGVRLPSARVWSPEDATATVTFNEGPPASAGFVADAP